MISLIIEHINESFDDLASNVLGISELITKDDITRPEFRKQDVIGEDTIYHRITGEIPVTEPTAPVNDSFRRVTYPMKLVATINKNKVQDCFEDAQIALIIMDRILNTERILFSRENKISLLTIEIVTHNLDRYEVTGIETNVEPPRPPDFDFTHLSIDYTVGFEGEISCFASC